MSTLHDGGAAAPGPVTPESDDARELGSSAGTKGAGTADSADSAQAQACVQADEGKRFATLRAHLALRGYTLTRTAPEDGPVRFYVARWAMVRELRDLDAVARFLEHVGGAA